MVLIHNQGNAGETPTGNVSIGVVYRNGVYTNINVENKATASLTVDHTNSDDNTILSAYDVLNNNIVDLGENNEYRYITTEGGIYVPSGFKKVEQNNFDSYYSVAPYKSFGSNGERAMFWYDHYLFRRYVLSQVSAMQAAQVTTSSAYTIVKPGMYLLLWEVALSKVANVFEDGGALSQYMEYLLLGHSCNYSWIIDKYTQKCAYKHECTGAPSKDPYRNKYVIVSSRESYNVSSLDGEVISEVRPDFALGCPNSLTVSTDDIHTMIIGKVIYCRAGDKITMQMMSNYGLKWSSSSSGVPDSDGFGCHSTDGFKLGTTNTTAMTNCSRAMSALYIGPGFGERSGLDGSPGPYTPIDWRKNEYGPIKGRLLLTHIATYSQFRGNAVYKFNFTAPSDGMYWFIFAGRGGSQIPNIIAVVNSDGTETNILDVMPISIGNYALVLGNSNTAHANMYLWNTQLCEDDELAITLKSSPTNGATYFECFVCKCYFDIDFYNAYNGFTE